ncbi:hypothetical protein LUZ60_010942 [Juncus effusus]|nr:hypothetical protein LUZ60_010942 [Juncus effusus]
MAVQLGGGIISSSSLLLSPSTSHTRPFSLPLFSSRIPGQNACQSRISITRNKRRSISLVVKNGGSSSEDSETTNEEKVPFGYSRKDVILIGFGVLLAGYGIKYGLEFVGVDPLQAGNVVQLIIVLGLTIGWISTYMFRVANKDMTYAKQLKSYEKSVMEKRLESLTEAELQVLLEQVDEEKIRIEKRRSSINQNS